jgi:hypothetical protein
MGVAYLETTCVEYAMILQRFLGVCVGLALVGGNAVLAQTNEAPTRASAAALVRAERAAQSLARELAAQCPLAAPGDQAAFDRCRQGLFQESLLRQSLSAFVLWGRQRDPNVALKDSTLTQLAPDVLAGLYLPLFMFNGAYEVRFVEREGLYQIRLQTAFRNRLMPGQFPYPFWHEAEKWATYQQSNEVLLWWNPAKEVVSAAQFGVFGTNPQLSATDRVQQPAFDGQWMWTDAQGQSQPKVTVFDGLFRADNPYITQLDAAYKTLALRLREGQCNECHVPSNPDKSKRLVLLQTPAHAGAEIKRVIKTVRADKMPRDDTGIEQPLAQHTKAALLRDSEAFDLLYDAAKHWEAVRARDTRAAKTAHEPRVQ